MSDVQLDPVFHLPMPPVHAVFNTPVANDFTIIYGIGAVAILLWAVLHDRNAVIALAMFLGGGAVSLFEPLFDLLTAVWHPPVGQSPFFTSFGREIPVWVSVAYVAYYGCVGYLTLNALLRGATTRAIWLWCLVPIVFDEIIEEAMLHFNLYYYYASQPFVLIKFPLYQPAGNTAGVFFGVAVLYFLSPYLKRGWKWFPAAIILMPVCACMGFVGATLPAEFAINCPATPYWATQLSGVACYGLMAAWVYAISLMAASDSPYRYAPAPQAAGSRIQRPKLQPAGRGSRAV
jgi:hypothetical protein